MSAVLTLHDEFDPALWRTASARKPRGATFLLTWTLDPIEGGIPDHARIPFSEALCSLGTVLFAADEAALSRATDPERLAPAFESGRHPWWMNAQWLTVVDEQGAGVPQIERFIRQLYKSLRLPPRWPGAVRIVAQAGVDGDAAACHCRDAAVKAALVEALRNSARRAGAQLAVEPSPRQA